MPAAYAHTVFGGEVYDKLPFSVQSHIDFHESLFQIGLQGPDILFYYHPSEIQVYVLYGHNIHKRPAADFFRYALNQLEKLKGREKEKGTAYLMGFLCHYILDRGCHPLVRKNTIPGQSSHREIERELDRFLMEKDNLRPEWFFPWTRTVPRAEKEGAIISRFYPEADRTVIARGIRNMRLYETSTTWFRMRKKKDLNLLSSKLEVQMKTQVEKASAAVGLLYEGDWDRLFPILIGNFG